MTQGLAGTLSAFDPSNPNYAANVAEFNMQTGMVPSSNGLAQASAQQGPITIPTQEMRSPITIPVQEMRSPITIPTQEIRPTINMPVQEIRQPGAFTAPTTTAYAPPMNPALIPDMPPLEQWHEGTPPPQEQLPPELRGPAAAPYAPAAPGTSVRQPISFSRGTPAEMLAAEAAPKTPEEVAKALAAATPKPKPQMVFAAAPAKPPQDTAFQKDLDRDVALTAEREKVPIKVAEEKERQLENRAGQKGTYTKEELDVQAKRERRDADALAEEERTSLAAKNFKLDPNRYMHNASFLQKALMLIGGAAGGISAGIKGGPNTFIDFLNKSIDRDIDQQKSQYEQLRARGVDLHNAWAMTRRKDENEDAQRATIRAMALDAVADHTESSAYATANPAVIANSKLAVNKVREMADLNRQQREDAIAKANAGGGEKPETQKEFDQRKQKFIEDMVQKGMSLDEAQRNAESLPFRGKALPMKPFTKTGKPAAPQVQPPDLSDASTAGSVFGRAASAVGLESLAKVTANNLQSQNEHNVAVDETVRKVFGTRGEAAERMLQSFRVTPGMDQATIDRRSDAFKAFLAQHDPNAVAQEKTASDLGVSENE